MPTSSIGTSSRNYSTLQLWEDDIPASVSTFYEGQCYNDSEFTAGVVITGHSGTSGTNYIKLTAVESAFDDESNPLKYDQTKGVAVSVTYTDASYLIDISNAYTTVEKLQIRLNKSTPYTLIAMRVGAAAECYLKDCVVDLLGQSPFTGVRVEYDYTNRGRIVNVLTIVSRNSGSSNAAIPYYLNGGYAYNCGAVWPTGITAGTGDGFGSGSGPFAGQVHNCYVFGCSGTEFNGSLGGDYNATDAASGAPGINSDHSLTYANQFESTSSWDFRIKTGNNLEDNGNTDATYAPNDIFGNVRGSGTAGTIGPHETPYSAGGGGALLTPWININSIITGSVH